jgi:hypothetical protein
MTVIAFRSRTGQPPAGEATAVTGTFRSPRGRLGTMTGHLRLQRLVLVPRGVFVDGVFTGSLHEPDGTLVGLDSRRVTAPADLVRGPGGLHPVVRPLELDLMGIRVRVDSVTIQAELPVPATVGSLGRRARRLR